MDWKNVVVPSATKPSTTTAVSPPAAGDKKSASSGQYVMKNTNLAVLYKRYTPCYYHIILPEYMV